MTCSCKVSCPVSGSANFVVSITLIILIKAIATGFFISKGDFWFVVIISGSLGASHPIGSDDSHPWSTSDRGEECCLAASHLDFQSASRWPQRRERSSLWSVKFVNSCFVWWTINFVMPDVFWLASRFLNRIFCALVCSTAGLIISCSHGTPLRASSAPEIRAFGRKASA